MQALNEQTPNPEDVVYEPSVEALEALPVFEELRTKTYGEMPIQIGFCNGKNHLLNALEYHRSSEINVGGTDAILLVGLQRDITKEFTYDTSLVEAFLLPKGTAVELYATTLHYAPCSAKKDEGFRVIIVLPKGTNTALPEFKPMNVQDSWMTARNKWLLAHAESNEAASGAYIGLTGENIDIAELI